MQPWQDCSPLVTIIILPHTQNQVYRTAAATGIIADSELYNNNGNTGKVLHM